MNQQTLKNKFQTKRRSRLVHDSLLKKSIIMETQVKITQIHFIFLLPFHQYFFRCGKDFGLLEIPVINLHCKNMCYFSLENLTEMLMRAQICLTHFECFSCQQNISIENYWIDEELENVIKILQEKHSSYLTDIIYETTGDVIVKVNKANEWFIQDNRNGARIILKKGNMYNEYQQGYPTHLSEQESKFYENGWLFVHENIDTQIKGKLQAALYSFFPSLQNSRWKEAIIFDNINGELKASYFDLNTSICRGFNKKTGSHFIMASGGLVSPDKTQSVKRSFIVELFNNNPEQASGQKTLVRCSQMIFNRAFHCLIQYKNYIYAIGGDKYDQQTKQIIRQKSCERYDIEKNQWDQVSCLNHSRTLFTTVIFQDKLLVIGGRIANQKNMYLDQDLSIESFDCNTSQWTIYPTILPENNQLLYFTERALSFVSNEQTILIFGGRKDANSKKENPSERERQVVELNLYPSDKIHQFWKDLLPNNLLLFDTMSDMQGIYYNNRYIFAQKQIKFDQQKQRNILTPYLLKLGDNRNIPIKSESYQDIML